MWVSCYFDWACASRSKYGKLPCGNLFQVGVFFFKYPSRRKLFFIKITTLIKEKFVMAVTETVIPVLDGGQGWLLVIAGIIAIFLSAGLCQSGGVIYVASVNTFSASRTVAAWIPMVTTMVQFLAAPVGTYLATRFTFELVVFIGGVLAVIGMISCYAADRIETVLFGWSILFGFGSSIALFPTLSLVGQCFKKKRPLATSLYLTAGGIGCVVLPLLLEYLNETFGLSEACLTVAGLLSPYFLCAALILKVVHCPEVKRKSLLKTQVEINDGMDLSNNEAENKIIESDKLDCSWLTNVTYLVNCFSNAIQVALYIAMVTVLPDYGRDEIGTSKLEGTYFVSASAVADLCSLLLFGLFLTKFKIKLTSIYFTLLVINVLDFIVFAYVPVYAVVFAASIVGGLCSGGGTILYFEILAKSQTPEKYPIAFGLSEMMKAPFLLATVSSIGILKDATGSYKTTFEIFAFSELVAASLWVIDMFMEKEINMN